MNTLLICPGQEHKVSILGGQLPLVTMPFLGQTLLEYWLSHLARCGTRQVLIAASDRPQEIRGFVGDGSRWGLNVRVSDESRPLSPAEAMLKYSSAPDSTLDSDSIAVLNHFPGKPDRLLFNAPDEFMAALLEWMPGAVTPDRVGMHEISPGVWAGVHSSISPRAKLKPPCWVGQHVLIEDEATIGPETIIEDGVVVEAVAEIEHSWIGSRTLVGEFTRIDHALAWGNRLLSWETGAEALVPDPFVLCALDHPHSGQGPGLLARAADLYRRNKERAPLLFERPHTA